MYEKFGTNILIKGGHLEGEDAVDILYDSKTHRFALPKVQNPNTHGDRLHLIFCDCLSTSSWQQLN